MNNTEQYNDSEEGEEFVDEFKRSEIFKVLEEHVGFINDMQEDPIDWNLF
jgi:hypothetical protein